MSIIKLPGAHSTGPAALPSILAGEDEQSNARNYNKLQREWTRTTREFNDPNLCNTLGIFFTRDYDRDGCGYNFFSPRRWLGKFSSVMCICVWYIHVLQYHYMYM